MNFLNDIDANNNEIRNFRVCNLAEPPESAGVGFTYFNTITEKLMVYTGTIWLDITNNVDNVWGEI